VTDWKLRWPRKELLLDSNILLLLAIGAYDPRLVGVFKRVSDYTLQDYEMLRDFAADFRELVATPHILTEVSNLANSLPANIKPAWFSDFSERITRIEERNLPAAELAALPEFLIFGLTDAALPQLAESTFLLTAENRLCDHLQRRKLHAMSFDEPRVAQSQKRR